jgi:hypothetical protein
MEGQGVNTWVNDYVDQAGKDTGRLLSVSPGLHIVLEGSTHKGFYNIGAC